MTTTTRTSAAEGARPSEAPLGVRILAELDRLGGRVTVRRLCHQLTGTRAALHRAVAGLAKAGHILLEPRGDDAARMDQWIVTQLALPMGSGTQGFSTRGEGV